MNKSRKFAALIIITVFLIIFCNEVRAQEAIDDELHGLYVPPKKVFTGGVVAGLNLAQVDGDYFAGYYKFGLNAGPIVYAQVGKRVALSMEMLYSQKGSKSNIPTPSVTLLNVIIDNYGINTNYVEVPVMINYYDKHKSSIGIGFSYNRLINSHETLDVDSANILKSINLNNNYPFLPNTVDFLAGINLHLWKGFYANLRFQYSITPIRTDIPPNYSRAVQYDNLWVVRLMYLLK